MADTGVGTMGRFCRNRERSERRDIPDRLRGKISGLVKQPRPAMCFQHCLCQEIDNCGMNIIAHEDSVGRRDDGHVSGRKFPLIIDQTLRHYQSNKKRENTRERFRRFEVDKAKIGIFQ